jgi:hypothetical protein
MAELSIEWTEHTWNPVLPSRQQDESNDIDHPSPSGRSSGRVEPHIVP